jgi:cell division protease FtsH
VKALERLRENRDRLDSLAKALLEHETLDERDAYAAAGFDRPPPGAEQGAPAAVAARQAAT